MFRHRSLFAVAFLTVIGAMYSSGHAQAPEARIKAGDKVVTTGRTALMAGKTTLLTLEAGTQLVAREIKGTWVRVAVQKEGRQIDGWIYAKHLAHVGAAELRGPKIKLLTKETSLGKVPPNMVRKTLAISPDGKRTAYVVKDGGNWAVVVDGVMGKPYDDILRGSLVFSPDSKRVAYGAMRGGKWLAVVDGEEGEEFDAMGASGLIFSPDSKRVAHTAMRGGKWLAVVDGVEGKEYDTIGKGSLMFSPDSKRAAYVAVRGGKNLAVVDGVEGQQYDAIPHGAQLTFDGPQSLHCVAVRDREFFRVEMDITQQ